MPSYQPKNIDCRKVKPHLAELELRCGSLEKAADFIGLGTSTLYRIKHNYNCTVQMRTAQLIIDGLQRRRKADRFAGEVNNKLIQTMRERAKREDRLKELTGY